MNEPVIVGVRVLHCQLRQKCGPFFKGGTSPESRGGSALIRLLSGSALFRINENAFQADRGDVVLYSPRALKEFRPCPGSSLSYYAMRFDLYSYEGEIIETSSLGLPLLLRPSNPGRILAALQSIERHFNGKKRFSLEACSTESMKLLRLLREPHQTVSRTEALSASPLTDKRIFEVLDFISKRYKTKLSIKELAAKAKMHPVHFNRLFKRVVGRTPHQFILDQKMEKVKDFLLLYDDQPSAMGLEFEFHDESHFYRTFKKRVGMTPSEYVRRNREERERKWL